MDERQMEERKMRRTGIPMLLAVVIVLLALPAFVARSADRTQDAGAAPVQSSDPILGRWDLTIEGTDGPYSSWLEVVAAKEPGNYHGRFVGRFGSVRPIARIEFKQGRLEFTLPPQYEKMTKHLLFTARLSEGELTGTTEGEDGRTLNWRGVRAPDLAPPKRVRWGKSKAIFNGKDLTGWRLRDEKAQGCWTVEDGVLTNSVPCVDLITEEKFGDFKLHVEFRLAEKSNSGLYLRGRYEVQILDSPGQPAESLGMGGVYGFLRPRINASRPAGEWQTYDITLIGRHVTVALNGETLLAGPEIPGPTGGALDSREGEPGPIMIQGDHGKIWLRNVTITPAK